MAEEHTQEDEQGEPTPPWSVDALSRQYLLAVEDDKDFIDVLFALALNPSHSLAILAEEWVRPRLAQIAARNAAKQAKNYAESDRIRKELLAAGIVLEDSAAGTNWRRA